LWFSHAAAVWGSAPLDAVAVVVESISGGSLLVVAEVGPDGQWLAELPLVNGQEVTLVATAIDAAGNQSLDSSQVHVGLSEGEVFVEPHASLSDMYVGGGQAVVLTAHTRTGEAPVDWVRAMAPAGAPIELERTVPFTDTWVGVWNTPLSGPYQGVVLVRFEGQDTAHPPETSWQTVMPYLDLVPPYLSVHYPADGHMQAGWEIVLGGRVEPFSTVDITAVKRNAPEVTFDGYAVANELGEWQTTVEVEEDGWYDVTVQAEDRAGNPSAPLTLLVTADTTGPAVQDLLVDPRFTQSAHSVLVSAELWDLTGVSWSQVLVSGVLTSEQALTETMVWNSQTGRYGAAPYVMSSQDYGNVVGRKPFTITAEDWLGNVSEFYSELVTGTWFIVDDTPPDVAAPELNINNGVNLYLSPQDSLRLYYGPESGGSLSVTAAATDTHPVTETARLGIFGFPDLFFDVGPDYPQGGVITAQVSHSYAVGAWGVTGNFQVAVDDRAGNTGHSGPFDLVWDYIAPGPENPIALLTLGQGAQNAYLVSESTPRLYYGPNASGALTAGRQAVEAFEPNGTQSGLHYVTFPALFGAGAWNDDAPGENNWYERSGDYTITWQEGGPHGLFTLDAIDQVGNVAPAPFLVLRDQQAPSSHRVTGGSRRGRPATCTWPIPIPGCITAGQRSAVSSCTPNPTILQSRAGTARGWTA
jgi:hypothetical protein